MNADSFGEGNADRILNGVNCAGNETLLFDCERSSFAGLSCTTSGVVCQGKTIHSSRTRFQDNWILTE